MSTLSSADIDRLERAALAQIGLPISTPIAVTPRDLLALCAQARMATAPAVTAESLPNEVSPP